MWPFKKGAARKSRCKYLGVVHIKRLGKPCRIFIRCGCGKYHAAKG